MRMPSHLLLRAFEHDHVRVRTISKDDAVGLIRAAGHERELMEDANGVGLDNKLAVLVDPEADLWVYNHDGQYQITTPWSRPYP